MLAFFVLEWESTYSPHFAIRKISRFRSCQKCPKTHKNFIILKSAIKLLEPPVIESINLVIYNAFCRTPQNRCFWPPAGAPGPKNHRCQPNSAVSHLKGPPWLAQIAPKPLNEMGEFGGFCGIFNFGRIINFHRDPRPQYDEKFKKMKEKAQKDLPLPTPNTFPKHTPPSNSSSDRLAIVA